MELYIVTVGAQEHPVNRAIMNSCYTASDTFRGFIRGRDFPCVGAKSALATKGMRIVVAGDLRDREHDALILGALQEMQFEPTLTGMIATAILFPLTPKLSESMFEKHLWVCLQALHDADLHEFAWDTRVEKDPRSVNFGMSIGGSAFFVVGLHPGSSRVARRAPMAVLAFNPHEQFRRLKRDGEFNRLRHVVRERDMAIQGHTNPMLADHGTASEAAQYSGRAVSSDWACPFAARSVA
jgi:FPC/CPF motif-containing protein YcgG